MIKITNRDLKSKPLKEKFYENLKNSKFEIPPVRFALVHLNKPLDIAIVIQTIISTGHVHVDLIGQSIKSGTSKGFFKIKIMENTKSRFIAKG